MKVDESLPQWQFNLPHGKNEMGMAPNYESSNEDQLLQSTGNILIVDDSLRIITSLNYIFKNLGCNTLLSFDGYTAIDHLIHNPVDLLILDMRMPLMNGDETLRKAQEVFKEKSSYIPTLAEKTIPYVIYTGMEDRNFEFGPLANFKLMEVWQKPMSFSALSAHANKAVEIIGA